LPKAVAPSPSPSVKPVVGVFPKQYKPGDTFKDCAECPEMVIIPAGSFRMGDLGGDGGGGSLGDYYHKRRSPVRRVNIPHSFAVGKYEVTQAEWRSVMGSNPSKSIKDDRHPVEKVSWNDAKEYLHRLSAKTNKFYRLLSEAEWEYSARAGTETNYSWGDEVGRGKANCVGCGSKWDDTSSAPVGSFQANPFGLHDMHGNVGEWVEDCWKGNYNGAPTNGIAWTGRKVGKFVRGCSQVVERGSGWFGKPDNIMSASRVGNFPERRGSVTGFRVARDLP